MKKLFSGNFILITVLSLVVLIGIVIASFFLFDKNDDRFIKSGYVLNPLSDVSEKYFFDKDTGYHKNLSSMIEFNDVDKKDVAVLSDSFLHYDDESLSFLKNGAILDLDSINGKSAVKFYNITSSSIIEHENGKYYINSTNGRIDINNFIGRINEDKYIVVGDLQLMMNGNSKSIPGKYFEIVYVEEGIVNIENKDVKYQVVTDGTSIMIGNKIVIDLADKKITSSGKDVMSITSITIDGNENIEIVPVDKPKEEDKNDNDGNEQDGQNNQNGQNEQNGNEQNGQGGDGNGGTGNNQTDGDTNVDEIVIALKEALISSTSVDVTFDVMNAKDDDNFTLRVVNLNSGRTVDMFASVKSDIKIKVNLLTPKTKYLFTVVNEKNGNKYFQKIFETNGFGIKLEKSYATSSALAYNVSIDEDTDITNAKLTLYKYNETTKKNEVVTTSYYDSVNGEQVSEPKIYNLNALEGNLEGTYEIIFDGLDSDTIYTAVLDEFSVASSNFKDIYNITLTSMTLKKVPEFSSMNVVQNADKSSFELSLGDIVDPDNAIIRYTYRIYDRETNELVITPIEKTSASPISVKIGDGENMLKNNTNYYYKVIIEYFDNEKYIEYITTDSITFIMGDDPYITVEADPSKVSYDRIGGTVYLTDNSCFISIPGREKCDGNSTTVFVVSKINPLTGELTTVYSKLFTFTNVSDVIKYDFEVSDLEEGTSYNIDVKAVLNNDLNGERVTLGHTDSSNRQITTKTLASFYVTWDTTNYFSDSTHVIDTGVVFNVDEGNTGTISPEESMSSIKLITIDLYEGNSVGNIHSMLPLKTVSFNSSNVDIKKSFYDEIFEITSNDTFDYTIDNLKNLNSEGKLSEYYTLVINAYYDNEKVNKVNLANNILAYQVNKFLLLDNIEEPQLVIEQITNKVSGYLFSNLNNEGTIVGYKLLCAFDRAGMLANMMDPQQIHIYVYDNSGRKVKFYYKDGSDNLILTSVLTSSLGDNNYIEKTIYLDYGTDYGTTDAIMSRGNKYKVGFEISVLANEQNTIYPQVGPGRYDNYKEVDTQKENPNVKMYIAKSTEDSIKYNYEILDPDNSLYAEGDTYNFYYKIQDGNEEKLPLELVTSEVKKFSGNLVINGLSKGDKYSLYYKKNVSKTGNFENDILPYIDNEDNGERIFDGYYDALATDSDNNLIYNFKYEIINDQLKDNNVVIKILATDDLVSRIVNYKITFNDSNNHVLVKELWQLNSCPGNSNLKRCMSVDYTELKNAGMKSVNDVENVIRVKIEAFYDNGLMGYEYKVGDTAADDYPYMIMQNNSTSSGMGKYVVFNRAGTVSLWNPDLQISMGYYTYTMNSQRITYKSKLNTSNNQSILYSPSSVGYVSNYGVLNPKMISVNEMRCDNNTFSFNSITPKLSASVGTKLLNGAVVNLALSGVDLADFIRESDGKYYVYVETWKNESEVGDYSKRARPMVKAQISESNPSSVIKATIDGVSDNSKYYYNVYVKMKKNNEEATVQLFDSGYTDRYETKTYTFNSLSSGEVYSSLVINYNTSKDVYGDRELNTKFNLIAYANEYPYNYDLVYVFCDKSDSTCGVSSESTNIFSKVIQKEDIVNGLVDTVDVSEYNLEFGKEYRIYAIARIDYYENSSSDSLTKKDVILNPIRNIFNLKSLSEPSFSITKNAFVYMEGQNQQGYGLDFRINLRDTDRTIIDGKYKIKLLDESGNIAGTMQLKNEDDEYYNISNYDDYEFDAWITNKSVRFIGLEPDTKYTFVAYADAFLNNYSETEETPEEEYARKHPRISESKTVYTVNDYGVAFGRDIVYSATARSIVVTFLGGSSFDNVMKVRYTIGLWDSELNSATTAGVFDLVETDKKFELSTSTDDWKFIIDPTDMRNVLGQTYTVNLSFEIKLDGNQSIWLTSADNNKFSGTVQYVEDK